MPVKRGRKGMKEQTEKDLRSVRGWKNGLRGG
jgi:hypothetical protein